MIEITRKSNQMDEQFEWTIDEPIEKTKQMRRMETLARKEAADKLKLGRRRCLHFPNLSYQNISGEPDAG